MNELIEKLQDLFQVGEANPIVLRALAPKGSKLSKPPHDFVFSANQHETVVARWAAALSAAARLNAAGFNLYTCLNPVSTDFTSGSVRDADIASRNLLLIDIDRRESTAAPASETELSTLSVAADAVESWMRQKGHEKAARVMSGNGYHLYYRFPYLPNDEVTRDACRGALRHLASIFDTEQCQIDTSVFNAGRITKLPGTIARKGAEADDRRFRKVTFA